MGSAADRRRPARRRPDSAPPVAPARADLTEGEGPAESARRSAERARQAAERASRAAERAKGRVGESGESPPAKGPPPPKRAAPSQPAAAKPKAPAGAKPKPASTSATAEVLRHRRGIAFFGGLLLVAVIVALIVGIGGGDDSGSRRTTLPDLPKSKQQGSNGIVLSVPPSWERVKNDGVIRLRSPLGDVQVLISSPAPAGQATAALKAELKAIANNYQVIDVGRPTTKEIGGLKGKQVVLTARQPNGKEVRILVITANGDQRAYVAEVVAAGDASEHNLAQGQQIINSLKLTG